MRGIGLWPLAVFGFLLVGCCLVLGLLVFFSPHHVVFPFPSMMTWALRPHGVRTRGKKRMRCKVETAVMMNQLFPQLKQ